MEKTKQELLKEWSELWVPKLNELSKDLNNPFYTQSPLDAVEENIDVIVKKKWFENSPIGN